VVDESCGCVWSVGARVVPAIKVVDCWSIGVEFVESDGSVWPVGGLFDEIVDESMSVVDELGGCVWPVGAGVVPAIELVDCLPKGVEFVKSDGSVWPV